MSLNLDEIEKALEEATFGGWYVASPASTAGWGWCISNGHKIIARMAGRDKNQKLIDAHLIANAPEWMRLLVERVKVAEQLNKDFIDAWENYDMHPGLVMAFRECGKSYKDAFGDKEST